MTKRSLASVRYRMDKDGYEAWELSYYYKGRRIRKAFKSEAEAHGAAKEISAVKEIAENQEMLQPLIDVIDSTTLKQLIDEAVKRGL